MPTIAIDFSKVVTYALLAPGKYPCVVVSAEAKTAKTGTPMLALKLEITSGDSAGRFLYLNMMLAGNALWRTRVDLKALLGDISEDTSFESEDLIGQECVAQVKNTVWREEDGGDGELRSEVSRLLSAKAHTTAAAADLWA